MKICGVDFYVRDGHELGLVAAGGWASRWMPWSDLDATGCCFCNDQTSTSFLRMEEETDNEYWLSAVLGRFRRQFRFGDLLQGSMRSSVQLCCLDHSYHTSRCYGCRYVLE